MKIAVVGASGAVGREMLVELLTNGFHKDDIVPMASSRSAGSVVKALQHEFRIEEYSSDKASRCEFALFSAGSTFSKQEAPKLGAKGTVVIDNSSAFRQENDIPLVVPEVNAKVLTEIGPRRIIANPNCSTIQLVQTLKPLEDVFGLELVFVSTMQSVSGTGQKGIEELSRQQEDQYLKSPLRSEVYPKPIANNLLPAIGALNQNGYCEEEEKIVRETRKILNKPELLVFPHTARVPVFHCHSETVTVKLKRKITLNEAISALRGGGGMEVISEQEHRAFPNPLEWSGKTSTAVFRLRLAFDAGESSDMLSYWNIADNLKVGAATNAVRILQACLGRQAISY